MDGYFEANKKLWNDWTLLHETSDDYDLEGFRREPMSLRSLELAEVGDVAGKSLLHVQCHFGKDTLSWAKLGATVTGADFSENSVALARSLSEELQIPATFVLSNVYDLPNVLEGQFDIVYTSYGVLGWLPDIERWGQVVGRFVKPGGMFYIAEVHPFAWVFDDDDSASNLTLRYPYFQGQEPLKFDVKGSYAAPESEYTGVEYGWNHTIGDYVNALIKAGLRIEYLHECPFLPWKAFPFMEKDAEGWWR